MKTDSQVQSDVQTELKWQPSLSAAQIGVAAKDGVVTLSGQVDHYTDKTAAEHAAKNVYGVKAVANDITVELPGSSKRTDADIAAAAVSALKWDFQVPDNQVKVVVKGCRLAVPEGCRRALRALLDGRDRRQQQRVHQAVGQVGRRQDQDRRRLSAQCRHRGPAHHGRHA